MRNIYKSVSERTFNETSGFFDITETQAHYSNNCPAGLLIAPCGWDSMTPHPHACMS